MSALSSSALRFPTCKRENKAFHLSKAGTGLFLEPDKVLSNGINMR